jgi:2,3-bisphosphoglycerate-independent phosphoglycerate mutase
MHSHYLGARLNSSVRWGRDLVWALKNTYHNYRALAEHMGVSIADESDYIRRVEDRRAEKVAKREENTAKNIARALHKWKHGGGEWQRRFMRSYVMVRLVRVVTHDPLRIQVSDQDPEKTKGWHHSSQVYIQTNNFGIEHLITHDHTLTQDELDDITQEVKHHEQQSAQRA